MVNAHLTALRGNGVSQWNGGAWFGSLVGGSLWMLLAAGSLVPVDALASLVAGSAWLGVNAIGVVLWRRRDRVAPYPAWQFLIAILGLAGLAVVSAMHISSPVDGTGIVGADPVFIYAALLICPALMIASHFRERSARPRRKDDLR